MKRQKKYGVCNLENLAIKWAIENAIVTEKDYTFDDLMELR